MKNKKMGFIGVILGLVLLLLCGCGGGGGGGTDPAPTPSDPLAPPSDPVTPPSEPDDTVNKDPLAGSEIDGLNLEQPGRPAIASDGTSFLVVSATTAADGTSKLVGILNNDPFSGTTFPDDWNLPIADLHDNATSSRPAAIFNGTHYCVVFQDGGTIYAQLINQAGSLLGSKVTLSTGDGNFLPVMAQDDLTQSALIVWVKYIDESANYYDLYSALISIDNFSGNIQVLRAESALLGDKAGDQNEPAIAFDGTNYLVLWRQSPDTSENITITSDIYGARVGANGTVIGSEFPVSTANRGQAEPQLAFDGTNYLAVWSDLRNADTSGYDIYGTRISIGGVVLDADGIAINTANVPIQNFPTVTWNGVNFVVAWANLDPDTPLSNGIYADAVNSDGLVSSYGNDVNTLAFDISGQPPAGTLYIYPVASDYLSTWVDLSGQNLLIDPLEIYYAPPL